MALMISGVSYADELRLEASASAKLGDLTLTVEEQVRHDLGVSEEMVTTAAPYEHTVFAATKSVGDKLDLTLRVRNTNTAGASTNRLSLDADTGEVIWHFQTVHHDVWDYDLPSQPTFYDFEKDGKKIKALAQTTKTGLIFWTIVWQLFFFKNLFWFIDFSFCRMSPL